MFEYNETVEHKLYGLGKIRQIFQAESDTIYGVDFKHMDTEYVPAYELDKIDTNQ
jgi:hypothetical protein